MNNLLTILCCLFLSLVIQANSEQSTETQIHQSAQLLYTNLENGLSGDYLTSVNPEWAELIVFQAITIAMQKKNTVVYQKLNRLLETIKHSTKQQTTLDSINGDRAFVYKVIKYYIIANLVVAGAAIVFTPIAFGIKYLVENARA